MVLAKFCDLLNEHLLDPDVRLIAIEKKLQRQVAFKVINAFDSALRKGIHVSLEDFQLPRSARLMEQVSGNKMHAKCMNECISV